MWLGKAFKGTLNHVCAHVGSHIPSCAIYSANKNVGHNKLGTLSSGLFLRCVSQIRGDMSSSVNQTVSIKSSACCMSLSCIVSTHKDSSSYTNFGFKFWCSEFQESSHCGVWKMDVIAVGRNLDRFWRVETVPKVLAILKGPALLERSWWAITAITKNDHVLQSWVKSFWGRVGNYKNKTTLYREHGILDTTFPAVGPSPIFLPVFSRSLCLAVYTIICTSRATQFWNKQHSLEQHQFWPNDTSTC